MIDGLRKGLEVICAFDDTTPKLTQSELAQRLDLSRAAARRYLMTLSALGYMATDGKAFWLTPKVMRLGHSYLASARLPRTVMPVLQTLTTPSANRPIWPFWRTRMRSTSVASARRSCSPR